MESFEPASIDARLRVLGAIRAAKKIARIDISQRTGLSPATVTAITAELLKAGLIEYVAEEAKPKGAKRGRPRRLLRLRAAAKLIAGVIVGRVAITVLLVDFTGAEVGHDSQPLSRPSHSAGDLGQIIMEAIAQSCQRNGLGISDVSGITVGLPGQIDGRSGHVHWSSSLTKRNVAFGSVMANLAHCPVFIENDANLVSKAEQLFGEGRAMRNVIVVTLDYGVGMGIVIDGQLYRGARGCGAELGHIKMEATGALCQCGQRGCLEAYVGDYALLSDANSARLEPFPDIAALGQAAQSGDVMAQSILNHASRYLAIALANLINIFDPDRLIIASKIGASHPLCQEPTLAEVSRLIIQADTPLPQITVNGWGDLMWAKGAAAYGIEQIAALSVRGAHLSSKAAQAVNAG